MNDVTLILSAMEQGDGRAADQLLPLVYQELRRLAAMRMALEPADLTLQATALVHEAYLRLVDSALPEQWNSRGHFFAAAAEAMRRILVERARSRRTLKRGGNLHRVTLDSEQLVATEPQIDLLQLDEALEQLASHDLRKAELVKLRYFAGLTLREAAGMLGISEATADADWAYAKAWLRVRMAD